MTGEIKELLPWSATSVVCEACAHQWVAVTHSKCISTLECPNCHEMKGEITMWEEKGTLR